MLNISYCGKIAIASIGIFTASGVFQTNQQKRDLKKFKSSPKYKASIVGLKSSDPLHIKRNKASTIKNLTIIFNYYDDNNESKICISYYEYNEYEVSYLLSLNTAIEVFIYKNKCTIATPIENFTDDIDKNEIKALLMKKFNKDIFKH